MKTNASIVKWPGGKKQELKIIKEYLPQEFQNYYEPFVGGGSCFLNIEAKKYFINDKCDDLINVYKSIHDSTFTENLLQFDFAWKEMEVVCNNLEIISEYHSNLIQDYVFEKITSNSFIQNATRIENQIFQKELKKRLNSKLKNVSKLNENKAIENNDIFNNIEASVKSAYYNYNRYLLNHYKAKLSIPQYSAIYFFIRDMAYSGMFRYCKNGNFNVPYGGIGYNAKKFESKITYFASDFIRQKFENTEIFSEDFYDFARKTNPSKEDFIFLDPPYDTEFSTYSQNIFDKTDQERLANFLINETSAKWMLIIKSTDFVNSLYFKNNLQIIEFDKTYQVSFQGRNDRKCTHLLITNYE
jgi:DNA adenine methylase